ncbi:MAG: hypothetical protein ACRBFS_23835 [Aureispira sp.]
MITLQEYFKEHQQSFWSWRDQTEVLALADGSTLVYKAYLIQVLDGLSLADTPPLDAVLLALAATKPQSKQAITTAKSSLLELLHGSTDERLDAPKGFAFLELLQQLPTRYHQEKERLFLLQTIFTNCYKAFSKRNMEQILTEYKKMSTSTFEQLVADDNTPMNPNRLFQALHILKELAERFSTVEELLRALEAAQNLEAPILEEETEIDPTWREKLVEDAETFYMATLLPALQAGLALPSLQRLQQQEAFGGTADLSNKGDFDRLLISEFAYDKTLFLSRLVNKEALYRQREASPERPSLTRHLLIDTSIYNWGSIKQIAFGIALALEKAEEDNINSLFYALGKKAELLSWNSVENVTKELHQVDPNLNSAEGLQAFFKNNRVLNNQEVVLISALEAVQQPAMQKIMRQYQHRLHYWIAPTAKGKISTYQYHTGKKLLQEFQLSLADAWRPDKVPKKANNNPGSRLQAGETPILVPEPRQYEHLLWSNNNDQEEVFMLAPHGHVLRCYDKNNTHGWEWLYGGLVDYTLAKIGQHSSGDFMLLVGMRSPSRLDLVNISTQTQQSIELPEQKYWHLQQFVYKDDAFYALDSDKKAWVIDIQEKPTLQSYPHSKEVATWINKHELFLLHERTKGKYTGKHYQILKNINTVSITERGHLLINGRHQLQLNGQKIIKIGARTSPTIVSAQQDYKKKRLRHFTFPDGSTIVANSLGLMILTSSNENLPPIYLPMILNKSLGMATKDHFCGNTYYHKNQEKEPSALIDTSFFFTMYLKPFIDTILGNIPV